jgi:centromere protein I
MFNAWIRDLYNFLWGTKALQVVENSPAFFCSPAVREALNEYLGSIENHYSIGLAFGLSYNPWLASLSATAWRALEEQEIETQGHDHGAITWHKGPVTLETLEALDKNGGVGIGLLEYKKFVLQWLTERGIYGLKKLMYSTHTRLRS